MKNILVLSVLLLFVSVNNSLAQAAAPHIRVGKVAYKFVSGQWMASTTTCAELLSDPRIVMDGGWKMVSFQVGIKASGKEDYLGPYSVNGTAFTQPIKEALKAREGSRGEIDFESIKAEGPDGLTRTFNPIKLKYTN